MVTFENVSKEYPDGTVAVQNLNLEIEKGELVVLIGPSGCGKTTSLKMINRLEEPTSGTIYVDGKDISSTNPVALRRSIGYVIQQIGLFPHMSIEENIAIVAKLHKWKKNKMAKRVDELLILAGLTPPSKYKYRLPDQLSGGQQQRIGVLRALAVEPNVVLMDEPFGALDPISRESLQNELIDLQQRLKKTIVFVTHDIDEALKLADKIVIMRQGKVVQAGTPAEIQAKPVNKFVADFIGQERLASVGADSPVYVIMEDAPLVVTPDIDAQLVLEQIEDLGRESAQIVDKSGRWLGMAQLPQVKRAARQGAKVKQAAVAGRKLYIEEAVLSDAAEMLIDADLPIPIVDETNKFVGLVTSNGIAKLTISRLNKQKKMQEQAQLAADGADKKGVS